MIMETPKKRMKQKEDEREGFDKRSPLRNLHLNRLQFHKSRTKKCSNLSSSSHSPSASVKALNSSLSSLPSPSSSSTTPYSVTSNAPVKSSSGALKVKPRSKGNEMPKRSKKTNTKSTRLRFGEATIETITPVGKIADLMSFDFCKNVREVSVSTTGDEDSATSVKTPPVEASESPEIQCGSQSKMVGLKSSATPVCYGAGHLLSGVSGKRKSRRRGSLRGGCEKVNLFDDEQIVISNSQDSSSPVLAEASVRWLLSPCDEEGSDAEIRQEECKMIHGNASLAFDLMSSPSTFCGNVSDVACTNSNYSGSFLAHSNKKLESLVAVNSISTSNCDNVSSGEGKYVRHNVIENSSVGSLSSGNIIQTPNSDSSSYEYVGWDAQHKDVVQFEIDLITETLNAVSMSSRSEISIRNTLCDDLNSSADSIIPIRVKENVDSVCSWVSDSTFESLALSQARMSWRDGLLCKVDESDCTPCLSDEQNDGVGCSGKQIKSCQLSQSGVDEENDLGVSSCLRSHLGNEFRESEDNVAEMKIDASPILLEYEPCVSVRGKEKLSEDRLNACAESICTNGSYLAASCDSDCT